MPEMEITHADPEIHTVGLAGVGLMGLGIATNLLRSGWRLRFLEHPGNQPVESLIEAGARSVQSGRELAACTDIIILCVTGSPQVEDILTSKDGILAGLKPGAVVVDCSTSLPHSTILMASKVAEAGGRFIDVPMTRTPREAMEGRLNLLVGGTRELHDAIRPMLSAFAENIAHVGGEAGTIGAGHAMKLVHNFVSLGEITVIAEAAASAAAAGIDPATFVDVLGKGGGGGAALERLKPMILEGNTESLKFAIANARKDISYYSEMAGGLGTSRVAADGILGLLEMQVQAGNGERFMPELVELLAATRQSGE